MRYLGLAVVLALAATGYVVDEPTSPTPGDLPAMASPLFAICPVEEGSGRSTDLAALSTVDGPVRLSLFTAGDSAGSIEVATGTSGSTVIPVIDVAAVGTVGGMVEVPTGTSAVGSVARGSGSLSAEACVSSIPAETFIAGATTASQSRFEIQLMNPFAAQAQVRLTVSSEAGVESNERLESVIVPSRASETIELHTLIPGREFVTVAVETLNGRVVAVARQGVGPEIAVWNAVAPAEDWYLAVPAGEYPKQLVLGNPEGAETEYQIDLYGPDGLEEANSVGTLPTFGQLSIDLNAIGSGPLGIRVLGSGPLVANLVTNAASGLASTTGLTAPAVRWMLPGASLPVPGSGSIVILNPGIEDVEVSVRALRSQTSVRRLALPAAGVAELDLEFADGFLVEATGPVVPMWNIRTATAAAFAHGVALPDE